MTCNETGEFVSALCDGGTIPREAAEHIGSCSTCQVLLTEYLAMGAELCRIASLTTPETVRPLDLKKKRGAFRGFWGIARENMRIPRFAFAALLVGIAGLSINLALVKMRAHGEGDASFHFEVAAIKHHPPDGSMNGGFQLEGDDFSVTNLTVQQLISLAYDLKMDSQLRGLPKWADADHWDIHAKIGDEALQAESKLTEHQFFGANGANELMIRNLLAQRFHLKLHHETKQLPIYELTIAKGGLKLKAVASDKLEHLDEHWNAGSGAFDGKEIPISILSDTLSHDDEVSRIVVDKTGLTDKYDIHLQWTPDDRQGTPDAGPTLFTAIEEQLGLKLVPAKGPVDTLVVDQIEKPSPN